MQLSRNDLRQLARRALEQEGYEISVRTVVGAAEGARLRAKRGTETAEIAVRTSLGREAGFTRTGTRWNTISGVDLAVVAVPSKSSEGADIYCFETPTLIDHFERALKACNRRIKPNAPIFIALDERAPKKSKSIAAGLGEFARWRRVLTFEASSGVEKSRWDAFVERVIREAAEIIGDEPKNIEVHFKISGRSKKK